MIVSKVIVLNMGIGASTHSENRLAKLISVVSTNIMLSSLRARLMDKSTKGFTIIHMMSW
jgi:hypothetical protein